MILKIVDIAEDGRGIGKTEENYTVFLNGVLPGDKVEAKVVKQKKNYAEGELLNIIDPSKDRIQSSCPISNECGGCDFQEYGYEAQLDYKKRTVERALRNIGGVDFGVENVVHAENVFNYRNKMTLHVNSGKIGYYSKKTHDVIDIEGCKINDLQSLEIKETISEFLKNNGEQNITDVMIRTSRKLGGIMVLLITNGKQVKNRAELIEELTSKYPNIESIVENRHSKNKSDEYVNKVLYGKGYIYDSIKDLKFKVSPETFLQINPEVTELIYDKVVEYADLKGNETVYDIYSGVGTISLVLGGSSKSVIGIESVKKSVENARENAMLNGIENVKFEYGRAEYIFPEKEEKADVIVVDPPRKGCEKRVLDAMISMSPEKIVYVSCNPSTLARDLKHLSENGYSVKKVQPFDMFSWTTHVETVVLLEKK